ncbi:MAG: ANTAR domain-containing protein [Clostridiales bacterium]|jgi:response regulator NasT|nr:ANTAR domain-containing protein [Clostridiales bacterium]
MKTALIVSASGDKNGVLAGGLKENGYTDIQICTGATDARAALREADFDLTVVVAPLPDGSGAEPAKEAAQGNNQAILLAAAGLEPKTLEKLEEAGVFVLIKPVSRDAFLTAARLAGVVRARLARLTGENLHLKAAVEDIRVIDRAKLLLIQNLRVSEAEAHRYIEKHAMDMRQNRRTVAENIIRTYDNS